MTKTIKKLNLFGIVFLAIFALSTLPPDCKVIKLSDSGIAWQYKDKIDWIENQDVHILNKEIANV